MKNIFIIILLLGWTNTSFAQVRLGYSLEHITEEFKDPSYRIVRDHTNEGILFVLVNLKNSAIAYYFDEDQICRQACILPNDQGALNYIVEQYNKQYVIISDTKWKAYLDNGIATIKLLYQDKGSYFFRWIQEKE